MNLDDGTRFVTQHGGRSQQQASSDKHTNEEVVTITQSEAELIYPEGGVEAWCVVLGGFCAMTGAFGVVNTAAVFQSYFSENQLRNHSASEIGWIFSLYLFILYFVGIQVGPIFDRHGPRLLVALGSLLLVASMLLLGLCSGNNIPPFTQSKMILSRVQSSIK